MAKIPNGYKKTEIGVIPEDWNVTKLQDISTVISSKRIYFSEYKKQGVPFYRSKEIIEKANGKKIESEIYISEERFNNIKDTYGVPSSGDILVSSVGTLGVTYLVNNETFYFKDGNLIWLKNIRESEPLYILYQTKSSNFKSQIDKSTGGSSQSALTIIKLKEFFLPLPSHSEQVLIAHTLSDIDSLITSLESLIEKKKMIRQGVMQELLTGKRRLPGFNGDWSKVTLGNIAKFGKGKGLAKKDILSSGKKECIHYGELFTIYGTHIKNIHCKTNLDGDVYLSLDNDVLMPTSDVTPTGLAKASCIRKNGVILGGGILVIRLINGFDGEFLSMKIRQDKNQILQLVTGTTVFHIYERDMNQFEFSTPEYDEQVAIVHTINDMNEEVDRLTEKLFKLKQIKQGAMQQLLTGKIRLINK